MNIGDLAILKRLTFGVDLRMSAGKFGKAACSTSKYDRFVYSWLNSYKHVCLLLTEKLLDIVICICNDGSVLGSMTIGEHSFAIHHYFHTFENLNNYKIEGQNYIFLRPMTQKIKFKHSSDSYTSLIIFRRWISYHAHIHRDYSSDLNETLSYWNFLLTMTSLPVLRF